MPLADDQIKASQHIYRFDASMIIIIKNIPANIAKTKYRVPISLAFVENNHLCQ